MISGSAGDFLSWAHQGCHHRDCEKTLLTLSTSMLSFLIKAGAFSAGLSSAGGASVEAAWDCCSAESGSVSPVPSAAGVGEALKDRLEPDFDLR